MNFKQLITSSLVIILCFIASDLFSQLKVERLKIATSVQIIEGLFYAGVGDRKASCHITGGGNIIETDSTYQYEVSYLIQEIDLENTTIIETEKPKGFALLIRCKNNQQCINYKPFNEKQRYFDVFETFVSEANSKEALLKILSELKEIQSAIPARTSF
ncbi:MAG: hypothetical protein CVT92_09520 [Bacteroidetes bacterium HGW-Bacteroidetes-1]|jgi:hypothetical protein|nr:MAG: hypothetical protein CVT92_09520 [Bacteroidetes bacterium HGW-Bacteroidetes-1]